MKKNILIYPCGADNAIEIYNSIRYSLHFNIYGANSDKDVSNFIFENDVIELTNISSSNFIDDLNCLIHKFSIDFLFPTHDDVIYFLSKNTDQILCDIIGGNSFINEICRYKSRTYELFKLYDFCPRVYNSKNEIEHFPIFIKPDRGLGSRGVKKITKQEDLEGIDFKNSVVTEFLEGKEYTVDCFSDKDNQLKYSFARVRFKINNGVSKISLEANELIQKKVEEIAEQINGILKFKGLWFFQVKEDVNGSLKLLEICPRIATSMSFSRFKGVNLPLLTLFAYLNWDVTCNIIHNNVELYRHSVTIPFYNINYSKVYIDFDDTIIINNKICLSAITFIYQCLNNNIKVYLITKHEFDIKATLLNYKLSPNLFSDIIELKATENKSDYIDCDSSIFIDNFYKERFEVFNKLGIPVFDVEGIQNLIKI